MMADDDREKIIEQALPDDQDPEMEAYLDLLFRTPGRFDRMIEEARRRCDQEEASNVIPLRRRDGKGK